MRGDVRKMSMLENVSPATVLGPEAAPVRGGEIGKSGTRTFTVADVEQMEQFMDRVIALGHTPVICWGIGVCRVVW